MNIEKVFKAVEEDEMNSPLPTIVHELENQGYSVKLEGLEVTANDLDADLFADLEKATNEFEIDLSMDDKTYKRYSLIFSNYHKFTILQKNIL